MSLILDALRRAERDKRAAETSEVGLLEYAATDPAAAHLWRARSRLLGAVAALMALLLAVTLILTIREDEQGDADLSPVVRPQPPVNVEAGVRTDTRAARATGDRDEVAALYRQKALRRQAGGAGVAPTQNATRASSEDSAQGTDQPLEGSASIDNAEAQEVAAGTDTSQPKTQEERPIDVKEVLRELRGVASRRVLTEHPAPLLSDLSQNFRDSVPTLMYLRHDYRSDGVSEVLLNATPLRVGQRTRNVEVREILSDSVVLRYGGTDFRLRALNSWVNL